MYRGTTPTFTFTLKFEANTIDLLNIAMAQNGNVKISKNKSDCTLDGYTVSVTLTEAETLSLDEGTLSMQLRVGIGSSRLASSIMTVPVENLLQGGALSDV